MPRATRTRRVGVQQKRAIVNVSCPASIRRRLEKRAKVEDRTLSAIARRAIIAELDRVEGKAA
jgi:predicted transcriptional regulator